MNKKVVAYLDPPHSTFSNSLFMSGLSFSEEREGCYAGHVYVMQKMLKTRLTSISTCFPFGGIII